MKRGTLLVVSGFSGAGKGTVLSKVLEKRTDLYYSYVEEQLSAGRDVILEIESQGAAKVRQKMPEAVSLFLVPPSFEELSRRLHGRGTDSEEVIQRRLATARKEAKELEHYDYIVINDTIENAVGEILAILVAEGCRKERRLELFKGV